MKYAFMKIMYAGISCDEDTHPLLHLASDQGGEYVLPAKYVPMQFQVVRHHAVPVTGGKRPRYYK